MPHHKKSRPVRILIAAGRVVLVAAMIVCLLGTGISALLKFALLNESFYVDHIVSDEYVTKVTKYMLNSLSKQCNYYQIPFDGCLDMAITQDDVRTCSKEYVHNLYTALKEGGEQVDVAYVQYPTEPFLKLINAYFDQQRAAGMTVNDDAAQEIATDLAAEASSSVNAFNQPDVLAKVSKLFCYAPLWKLADCFWLFAVSSVALITASMFLSARTLRKRLYVTSGAIWSASAIYFIPTLLFKMYDFPSLLVLAASPLKYFLDSAIYTTIAACFVTTLCVFLLSTLLLIISIIWILWKRNLKNNWKTTHPHRTGHHHHHSSSSQIDFVLSPEDMSDSEHHHHHHHHHSESEV